MKLKNKAKVVLFLTILVVSGVSTTATYAKNDKLPKKLQALWDALLSLEARVEKLEETYSTEFQGTFVVAYNIPAGTRQTWSFDCGYGIIWEATIEFSSDYVSLIFGYRLNGKRYFVGSSGRSLSHLGYPPQTNLYGKIYCDVYDGDYPTIWVRGYISTQFPEIDRSGNAYIDLS